MIYALIDESSLTSIQRLLGEITRPTVNPWFSIYIPLASTIVVAVATAILVWLTSCYVKLTGHLVETAKQSHAPLVGVDFETPDHSLRLVIVNYGQLPAKNIIFTVLKDIAWLQMHKDKSGLAEFGPIKNGISYITPSRKLKYYLGFPDWDNTKNEDMSVSIRVMYEDDNGTHYVQTVDFDFGQMSDVMFESFKDPNLAVAEAIRQTEQDRRSRESMKNIFSYTPKKKECSMCAEMIPEKARKCSHCGEIFEKIGVEQQKQ